MKVYWNKKKYKVAKTNYNGEVHAWLKDGVPVYTKPKHGTCKGYIFTDDGVVAVVRTSFLWVWILPLTLILLCLFWRESKVEYNYYPVAFAEHPVYSDGTLYCNVVNVHDEAVTVQFTTDTAWLPGLYVIEPGETLPYIDIDEAPTAIVYGGQYSFKLEVVYD